VGWLWEIPRDIQVSAEPDYEYSVALLWDAEIGDIDQPPGNIVAAFVRDSIGL
jgi:hypothetical protein